MLTQIPVVATLCLCQLMLSWLLAEWGGRPCVAGGRPPKHGPDNGHAVCASGVLHSPGHAWGSGRAPGHIRGEEHIMNA